MRRLPSWSSPWPPMRLVAAVLVEQHDQGLKRRRCLGRHGLVRATASGPVRGHHNAGTQPPERTEGQPPSHATSRPRRRPCMPRRRALTCHQRIEHGSTRQHTAAHRRSSGLVSTSESAALSRPERLQTCQLRCVHCVDCRCPSGSEPASQRRRIDTCALGITVADAGPRRVYQPECHPGLWRSLWRSEAALPIGSATAPVLAPLLWAAQRGRGRR